MKVFLGGTVNDSKWRDYVMPRLEVEYFNPVVADWNDDAYKRELFEREHCDFCLYVITPRMIGYYALAEVIDDSYKKPDRTVYCYLPEDAGIAFEEHQIKSLEKLGKAVTANGGSWYRSLDEVIVYLNSANQLKDSIIYDPNRVYDVFISYGRRHSLDFAHKLDDSLTEKGYKVWFDMNDIPLGVDFQEQIDAGIQKADNFVFVISPHSVKSVYCLKEITLAIKYNKRIIPLLHVMPDDCFDKIHPLIARINWIYFDAPEKFDDSYLGLRRLINSHKNYVRQHTIILDRAIRWKDNGMTVNRLLVDNERLVAEKWLHKTAFHDKDGSEVQPPCVPTDLQCEYICESKKNAYNFMTEVYLANETQDDDICKRIRISLNKFGITTWSETSDIKSGKRKREIEQGIEQADNFIFMISPYSVTSKSCLAELDHAIACRKRIIPVLVYPTDVHQIPPKLRTLHIVSFTDNKEDSGTSTDPASIQKEVDSRREKSDYEKDIDDLIVEIGKDKHYYEQHKIYLVQAIKWKEQKRNHSVLLRGHALENAKTWLKLAERKDYKPTELHHEFINESAAKEGILGTEVFISYSRADADFARKLNEELQLSGKTTWVDQESIAPSSDFQKEIFKGIEISDNFLFVISPKSVKSPYCIEEVAYAARFNKRTITILHRDTNIVDIPSSLSAIQWIDFSRAEFYSVFSELIRSLDTDREYVRKHTKYMQLATDWSEDKDVSDAKIVASLNKDPLLRGTEFSIAQEWLNDALHNKKHPVPTFLQEVFIAESKKLIETQTQTKRRNLRVLRTSLGAALVALIVAICFVFIAFRARNDAEKARNEAVKQKGIALANEQRANEAKQRTVELLRFLIERTTGNDGDTISNYYYNLFSDKAISQFHNAHYINALTNFEIARLCPDAPKITNIDMWVKKTRSCLQYKTLADSAYNYGNYTVASSTYRSILTIDSASEVIEKLVAEVEQIVELKNVADEKFRLQQYQIAKQYYKQMLALNDSDRYARQQVTICDKNLTSEPTSVEQKHERKLALVIGNSEYTDATFQFHVKDAVAVATLLEARLKFDVIKKLNLSQQSMNSAIDEFSDKLKNYDVGILYYSGKGLQIGKDCYLQPVDKSIWSAQDTKYAISLKTILDKLSSSGEKMKIIILECDRLNPFTSNKPVEIIEIPPSTAIWYSTSANQIAMKEPRIASVFTLALLKELAAPSLSFDDIVTRVNLNVKNKTNSQQIPYFNNQITHKFVLNDKLR